MGVLIVHMVQIEQRVPIRDFTLSMWEDGGGGFYKFLKKYFVAQETIDLNIS